MVLQPVQPKLAGSTSTKRFRFVKPNRSQLNMLAVLTLLGIAIAFWFLAPRDWITPNNDSLSTANNGSLRDRSNQTTGEPTTPFKDAQQERAREAAQTVFDEFVQYQDEIERNQYGTEEHSERESAIYERANKADLLFSERRFDEAISEYEQALQDIKQLLDDMNTEFNHWVEQGTEALQDRDFEISLEAWSRAQAIKPLDQDVQAKLARVQLLPKVNELIRESERARIKEDWVQALEHLNEVTKLDPLTLGITDLSEQILERIKSQDLKDALTDGHEQLAGSNFDSAEQIFEEILVDYPENTAAQTGLQQVERARLAAKIEALKVEAREKEDQLDMRGALKIYDEALALDDSLQFAVEGRERVFEIISVVNDMNDTLQDPHSLSADDAYEEAKETLETAQSHRGHSGEYDKLLQSFADLVSYAGTLLPVVLISDEMTEVTLTTRQRIGSFKRHELMLRPGRYTLHGTRDGWVDIRKPFIVEQDMDPVSIFCEEQI
ncbi:MAG: hypothetical protein F4W92_07900 [Gammaproteobacteria bacterium]|nr:hypothetical protein [Gammaproteobacteria bacterium]